MSAFSRYAIQAVCNFIFVVIAFGPVRGHAQSCSLLQHSTRMQHLSRMTSSFFESEHIPYNGISLDLPMLDHMKDCHEDLSNYKALHTVGVPGATKPLTERSGVLCPTLLHESIRDHFASFANAALGRELGLEFVAEMERQCKDWFTESAWKQLWQGYTGNWSQNEVDTPDNEIFGAMGEWLNNQRDIKNKEADNWTHWRNREPENKSALESLLRHIAGNPTPTIGLTRIMDFGCGDGVELTKVARGLGLQQSDTFGIDVREIVEEEVRDKLTFMLAPTSEVDYENALNEFLENKSLRGTVSAIFSQVTFHHITSLAMRKSAISFIRDALAADGIFLLAEWDNPGVPIDYTIYYDISHFLPALFFGDPAPTDATIGKAGAEYLSVQGWIELFSTYDVPFNAERSNLPFTTENNSKAWLSPFEAAEKSSGRNFFAVFGGKAVL